MDLRSYCDGVIDGNEIRGILNNSTVIGGNLASHDTDIKAALATHDADIKALLATLQKTVDEANQRLKVSEALERQTILLLLTPTDGGTSTRPCSPVPATTAPSWWYVPDPSAPSRSRSRAHAGARPTTHTREWGSMGSHSREHRFARTVAGPRPSGYAAHEAEVLAVGLLQRRDDVE